MNSAVLHVLKDSFIFRRAGATPEKPIKLSANDCISLLICFDFLILWERALELICPRYLRKRSKTVGKSFNLRHSFVQVFSWVIVIYPSQSVIFLFVPGSEQLMFRAQNTGSEHELLCFTFLYHARSSRAAFSC